MDRHKRLVLVLAGLMHDIGKIESRAGGPGGHGVAAIRLLGQVSGLVPAEWRGQVWKAIANHHAEPTTSVSWALRLADQLASGALVQRGPGDPATAPLRPIVAQVDVGRLPPQESWAYPLEPLGPEGPSFPEPEQDVTVSQAGYVEIRDGLQDSLGGLAVHGGIADMKEILGLVSALRRWTTYVPASAPGEDDEEFPAAPTVSLYHHLKLTGALAACLGDLEPEQLAALSERRPDADQEPIALMLRADFSGIQSFIYRITASRADGTFSGAARRLRGRSLYLALLADVVVDWVLRRLGLPSTNVLFNGGGRFDLLLPLRAQEDLAELERELQEWLLSTFYGELGIQLATAPIRTQDVTDMREVYAALEDDLALGKQRKFELFVRGEAGSPTDFHTPHDQRYHACSVCHLTPLAETSTCIFCRLHEQLGQKLPTASHIAYLYADQGAKVPDLASEATFRLGAPFNVTVALLEAEETNRLLQGLSDATGSAALYRLNDVDFIPADTGADVALGFRFLANEAPVDARGYALDFDQVAQQSPGAQLLGILKADVDRLGFIFGEGMTPTLSGVSTLSGALDLYFGGRLDDLCREVAENAFYTVYAGGDDVFILGPWDQVLELATHLYDDFRRYNCYNDNITLSAGVLLVKPHFPIHRFAKLVSEALDEAKDSGRDRISVFARTVEWKMANTPGYDELLAFGKEMAQAVQGQKLHKGFVYFLRRLHDAHFEEEIGQTTENPMWLPKFHYGMARQVSEETIHDLDLLSRVPGMMEHIQIPVSYVSLKTRKE